MIHSPLQKYQQSTVQTATPAQLIILLYDGAIKFIRLGVEGIQTRKYDSANRNLVKAQAVIHELVAALDFKYPIANNLAQIYEYMIYQLIQSNLKKNAQLAIEVMDYLIELKDAWREASKQSASGA